MTSSGRGRLDSLGVNMEKNASNDEDRGIEVVTDIGRCIEKNDAM